MYTPGFCIFCSPIQVLSNGTCFMQLRGANKNVQQKLHPPDAVFGLASNRNHIGKHMRYIQSSASTAKKRSESYVYRHTTVSSTPTSNSQFMHHRIARPPRSPYFTERDVRSQVASNRTLGPYYGLQCIHPIMLLRCCICRYSRPGTICIYIK